MTAAFQLHFWLLPLMSLIGVALVTKCVISYSQRKLREDCIIHLYSSKRRLICPSLLTRRSALVLKWACRMGAKAFKRRLVYSAVLIIITLYVPLLKSYIVKQQNLNTCTLL